MSAPGIQGKLENLKHMSLTFCSSWAWDSAVWTQVPSAPLVMTLTYGPRGQVTTLRVPATWDIRGRNMARALATAWQLNIEEERPMFWSDEVWTMDRQSHTTTAHKTDAFKKRSILIMVCNLSHFRSHSMATAPPSMLTPDQSFPSLCLTSKIVSKEDFGTMMDMEASNATVTNHFRQ